MYQTGAIRRLRRSRTVCVDAYSSPPPPPHRPRLAVDRARPPADTGPPAAVSANPVDYTPHVLDGTVRACRGRRRHRRGRRRLHRRSSTRPARRSTTAHEHLRVRADHRRGAAVRAEAVDGAVYARPPGRTAPCTSAARSRRSAARAQRGLAQLDLADGTRVRRRSPATINWGDIRGAGRHGPGCTPAGRSAASAGSNRPALARLNATTGAADTGVRRASSPRRT